MTNEKKRYHELVAKAETAFFERRFLEAFLIQACLFESVIKDFAALSLKSVFEGHPNLRSKSKNFEVARLVDELFVAGVISKDLYQNLDEYRRKRNKVIHQILKFETQVGIEKELKKAYEAGREMKGFIVDEMVERKKGMTHTQLVAKTERMMAELGADMEANLPRHLKKMEKEFEKNFNIKFSKTVKRKSKLK